MNEMRWSEGLVDRTREHFELRWGSSEEGDWTSWVPVALVGRTSRREFVVQFLRSDDRVLLGNAVEEVRRDLDLYLVDKGEADPWAYAQYHCGTSANVYSRVHWSFSGGQPSRLEVLGTFFADRAHQKLFRSGVLIRAWSRAYPMLFTAHDVRLAHDQRNNHYFEWLGAILLYHTYGFLSLLKYEFPLASRRKAAKVAALLGRDVLDWLHARQAKRVVQCPDLLVFSADGSDIYFCEVKGPTDTLRPQQEAFFHELVQRTRKPVKLVRFSWRNPA